MSKQELGPYQLAWIQSLEAGGFGQCHGKLKVIREDGPYHCCLGVACEVYKVNGGGVCEIVQGNEHPLVHQAYVMFNGNSGSLIPDIQAMFRFRSPRGEIKHTPESKVWNGWGKYKNLACGNDDGRTLLEIAQFCRTFPECVFSEPA